MSELRQAVANLYNVTYRRGKVCQYTYENVCIVPGGRAGLSRVAAVIGDVYTVRSASLVSHFCVYEVNLSALVVPSPGLYCLRSGFERFQAIGSSSHCVSDRLHYCVLPRSF